MIKFYIYGITKNLHFSCPNPSRPTIIAGIIFPYIKKVVISFSSCSSSVFVIIDNGRHHRQLTCAFSVLVGPRVLFLTGDLTDNNDGEGLIEEEANRKLNAKNSADLILLPTKEVNYEEDNVGEGIMKSDANSFD
ncbi:hypothetical protein L2E82_04784 [Cichorium intybus]|uniref:Uncharacterized protein n=1 Tax=Cichorium intybus TaxID=13427 RepID=A0ACB9H5J8_CICIN|nr:hypothetical protein L2E82_04784 [Cichorium intybus]